MKKGKILDIIAGTIIALIGLSFIVYFLHFRYIETQLRQTGNETIATITDISSPARFSRRHIYVRYIVNDQYFTIRLYVNVDNLRVGNELRIVYDPNNLTRITIADHTRQQGIWQWVTWSTVAVGFGATIVLNAIDHRKQKKEDIT